MRLLSLLGVCMRIVAIEGKFFWSNVSTNWHEVQCNLAEPELDFSRFELKENIDVTAIDSDAWIGYIWAKVPFLLLGCVDLPSGFDVDSIGQCYNLCNGGIFGIKELDRLKCRCASDLVHTILQQCNDTSCLTMCNNVYMQYEMTQPVQTSTFGNCLMYKNATFYWTDCANRAPTKVVCSTSSYFETSTTAMSIKLETPNWLNGNAECLKRGMFPATQRTVLNTVLNKPPDKMHWTGIIRSRTLIRKSKTGNFRSMAGEEYAYVEGNDRKVELSKTGMKKALCVRVHETTTIGTTKKSTQSTHVKYLEDQSSTNVHETTTIGTTIKSTQSTNANNLEDQSSTNDGPTSYVIVGVSVALLVVGGAVIVVLLTRRGNIKCWQKTNISRGECNLLYNGPPASDTASAIDNCNHFTGKCTQSDPDIVIQRNTSCPHTGDTNYESVEETEETYARVENENDNGTTRTTATARKSKTLDNVYDKLNDSRSLLIGHQDGKVHVLFHKTVHDADDDYDVASATRATIAKSSHVDEGDYNHINPPTAVTQDTKTHNMDDNTCDYNIINGNEFKMEPSDTTEYGHLQTGRT